MEFPRSPSVVKVLPHKAGEGERVTVMNHGLWIEMQLQPGANPAGAQVAILASGDPPIAIEAADVAKGAGRERGVAGGTVSNADGLAVPGVLLGGH
jgi:hypothetical protein